MAATLKLFRQGVPLESSFNQDHYEKEMEMKIDFGSHSYTISLSLNSKILAKNFFVKTFKKGGPIINKKNMTQSYCYYIGKVEGEDSLGAAFSTCLGIKGMFRVDNQTYYLNYERKTNQDYEYFVVLKADNEEYKWSCGEMFTDSDGAGSVFIPNKKEKKYNDKFIIELYVANDQSRVEDYAGKDGMSDEEENDLLVDTINIVNSASLIYQPQGFFIVLIGVENWEDGNKINVVKNSNLTIVEFSFYRQNNILPQTYNDVAYLFSNITMYSGNNEILGKAYLSKMCGSRSSGLVLPKKYFSVGTGAVLAHEIGHNLGLNHYNQFNSRTCECKDSTSNCIMKSYIYVKNPPSTFSSCSEEDLKKAEPMLLTSCLLNTPDFVINGTKSCGNGILEDGEECDCGALGEKVCSSSCCSKNCKLIGEAECAQGSCCDLTTCRIKTKSEICRTKDDECEIEEYCDGIHSFCSGNIYKHDGTSCSHGYCYNGKCRSRKNQCEALYGGPKNDVQNQQTPNWCGYEYLIGNLSTTKCLPEQDSMCGVLWCEGNLVPLTNYYYYSWKTFTRNSGSYNITSFYYDIGTQAETPSLVFNGSPCGSGKACLDQKCVDVSTILAKNPCPGCLNGGTCSNLGICMCPERFEGQKCENTIKITTTTKTVTTTYNKRTSKTTSHQTIKTPSIIKTTFTPYSGTSKTTSHQTIKTSTVTTTKQTTMSQEPNLNKSSNLSGTLILMIFLTLCLPINVYG